MELLRTYDRKDYDSSMPVFEKYSVRGVILKDGKMAVQRSSRGECKILGGGVDIGETWEEALIREVREESGLWVVPESIRAIGEILEKRRDLYDSTKVYICHSMFFCCDVREEAGKTEMTESEQAKGFHLEWLTPGEVVRANEDFMSLTWIFRDTEFVRYYFLEKKEKEKINE